jgi:FOG: FHA domain
MTAPAAAAVSASSVPAPVSGSTSFWRSPALWLLLAFLLLALGLYYWWQSQKEEEYELEGIEESINPDLENDDREPSVDVERAFIFDPGPVTAPLGGVGLSRPVSPFSLVFPATSRKIPLRQGVVTIGSSPDSSIVLEEMEVSPNHAEIYVMDGECDIRITAPGNEVKVNGRPLSTTRTALKPGDEVRIGRTLAVLWRNEPVDRQNYKKYQRKTQRG